MDLLTRISLEGVVVGKEEGESLISDVCGEGARSVSTFMGATGETVVRHFIVPGEKRFLLEVEEDGSFRVRSVHSEDTGAVKKLWW